MGGQYEIVDKNIISEIAQTVHGLVPGTLQAEQGDSPMSI